ncbi:uncharacterized protein LOC118736404 [Rhagoletis pomonella]|uniref:uncharacterized protein LOC118736404 n=1 Tax=Rhagoletis pomonella TaxID=28610 RepID=UPI00177D4486|nr:uncharacterized protein LOC118736404 [Rhagoletis pomonella]
MRPSPEPPDKTTNRFSMLSEMDTYDTHIFPTLHQKQTAINQPKYLTISSTNNQLAKLSPFIIKKGIDAISTQIDSIKQLKDGSLLVLARNSKIADKFLKTKTLSNVCPITVKLQENLNTVKGMIYAPCLNFVKEEEIIEELKSQGVSGIYKFTRTLDGKTMPTGKMAVNFDLYHLPKTLDIAWYKVKVSPYYPNPMRCKNCQLLGHTKTRCTNPSTCDGCNLPPHSPTECTRKQCANCGEDHFSSDRDCPRYKQTKEILKIKTIEKCSMGEARRKYSERLNHVQKPQETYSNICQSETNKSNTPTITTSKRSASPTKTNTTKIPKTHTSPNKSKTDNVTAIQRTTTQVINNTNQNANNSIKKTTTNPSLECILPHFSKAPINTQTNTSASPLSNITQQLLSADKYFMSVSDSEEEPKL